MLKLTKSEPTHRLASSVAGPINTPDELFDSETQMRCVVPQDRLRWGSEPSWHPGKTGTNIGGMMENGDRVEIRLSGEDADVWHVGTVLNARKQWVQLDDADEAAPMIADENNIVEWRAYVR